MRAQGHDHGVSILPTENERKGERVFGQIRQDGSGWRRDLLRAAGGTSGSSGKALEASPLDVERDLRAAGKLLAQLVRPCGARFGPGWARSRLQRWTGERTRWEWQLAIGGHGKRG